MTDDDDVLNPVSVERKIQEVSNRIAAGVEAAKAGRALDRKSGDVIPGITFEPTTAYVKVDFTTGDIDGREHIRRAWRDGIVSIPSALALPAGTEGAA